MKKFLLIGCLFTACASTQPIQTVTQTVYVRDTITVTKAVTEVDTITRWMIQTVAYPITGVADSGSITLRPSGGDDQPQIQAAVNAHLHVKLTAGTFWLYRPVIVANVQGSDYGQSWCWISGAVNAQNAPSTFETTVVCDFDNGPGFTIQQGKGCVIENLSMIGMYQPPQSQMDVDTLRRTQWRRTRDVATSPYAAIVIDPFSDPAALGNDTTKMYPGLVPYYLPGMSRSGSTAIQVTGCNIGGFSVGILITAVNQQNGESILIDRDQIGDCMSAIASTQAQAKMNVIRNCMFWGVVHTIVDGVHYGIPHTDGATIPDMEDCNVAGMNYQLAESYSNFLTRFSGVYTESLFKIGSTSFQTSAGAPVIFDGCQFDLQTGSPAPDFWYHGYGTSFRDCQIRYYGTNRRIVLNDRDELIAGGSVNNPVRVWGQGQEEEGGGYDSIVQSPSAMLQATGGAVFFLTTDTAGLVSRTLILTPAIESIDSLSLYHPISSLFNYQTPLGYVDHVSADTVFLDNVGAGFSNRMPLEIYKALIKTKY